MNGFDVFHEFFDGDDPQDQYEDSETAEEDDSGNISWDDDDTCYDDGDFMSSDDDLTDCDGDMISDDDDMTSDDDMISDDDESDSDDGLFLSESAVSDLLLKTFGIERPPGGFSSHSITFSGRKICATRHGCKGATNCDYAYGAPIGQ